MRITALALLVAALVPLEQPVSQHATARALRVIYADGRTTITPVSDRSNVRWTASFPRVAGASTTTDDGLPLFALQFEVAAYAKWLDAVIVKFDAWRGRIRNAR